MMMMDGRVRRVVKTNTLLFLCKRRIMLLVEETEINSEVIKMSVPYN